MTVAPTLTELPKGIGGKKRKKQTPSTDRPARDYKFVESRYVVPVPMLRAFIEQHATEFDHRITDVGSINTGVGFLEMLAQDMAMILRQSQTAVIRRLYDVMHDKSRVCSTAFAEAAVMSFGLMMDADTDLPSLPGTVRLAKDLVAIRAEMEGEELSEFELTRLAHRVHRLATLIVKYPHHVGWLSDMAPYDCLRPMR